MAPQQEKDLNKALNLSMFSLVGWIVPIVGLVLAVVAVRLAHGVSEDSHFANNKKNLIQGIAIIGTLLSFAAGYFYYNYYANLRTEAENKVKQEQAAKSQEQSDALLRKYSLDSCLSSTEKWWNDNFAGKWATYEQQALDQQAYQAAKDDCYRRNPQ